MSRFELLGDERNRRVLLDDGRRPNRQEHGRELERGAHEPQDEPVERRRLAEGATEDERGLKKRESSAEGRAGIREDPFGGRLGAVLTERAIVGPMPRCRL